MMSFDKMFCKQYEEKRKDDCLIDSEIGNYARYPIPFDRIRTDYYNSNVMSHISDEVTKGLNGVHPDGKKIIVSKENILSVMDSIYEQYPHVPIPKVISMVVSFIIGHVKDEFETIEKNNKLNIEVLKYTGEYGIRKYPILKIRENHPLYGVFDLRY